MEIELIIKNRKKNYYMKKNSIHLRILFGLTLLAVALQTSAPLYALTKQEAIKKLNENYSKLRKAVKCVLTKDGCTDEQAFKIRATIGAILAAVVGTAAAGTLLYFGRRAAITFTECAPVTFTEKEQEEFRKGWMPKALEFFRQYSVERVIAGLTAGLMTAQDFKNLSDTWNKSDLQIIANAMTGKELKFPSKDLYPILELFKFIRLQIGTGTKYRSPTMLVPCIIYAYYKGNNKPIHERDLLEVAGVSKKDFNSFKYSIIRIWPQYQERNRKEYVVRRVLELVEHFNLGMPFFYQSKKILSKFYENIKNTKDDIIVGLVCSITLLCTRNNKCRVSNLCDMLGIKMSAIQKQVERKVFERFRVGGFRSLVKSANLLKKIMAKLGVFENKEKPEEKELVQITLGSASPVFNANEDLEYYLFVKGLDELLVVSVNSPKLYTSNQTKEENPILTSPQVELWKYYSPVGPPLAI